MPKYVVKAAIQRGGKRHKDEDGGHVTIKHLLHKPEDVIELSEEEAAQLSHAVVLYDGKKGVEKPQIIESPNVPLTEEEQKEQLLDEIKTEAEAKAKAEAEAKAKAKK